MSTTNGSYPLGSVTPGPTGNMLVLMRPGMKASAAAKSLENASGMKVAVSRDYKKKSGSLSRALGEADSVYLDHLNVAVVRQAKGADAAGLSTSLMSVSDVTTVRPEFYMYAFNSIQKRYTNWVNEGLHILVDAAQDMALHDEQTSSIALRSNIDIANTWGINAIKANESPFTGKGIKIAVLDTGLDETHPDFEGRTIVSESFVPGEDTQDGQGHGTHCTGTAAGPAVVDGHPRYGVATEADIYIGKVLSNAGSGAESWILAGMNWAIESGCEIISMSLGRATQPGERPDPIYEAVGKVALENNLLIIAAAGNESARQFGYVAPVGAPANVPSIMAVGAVDHQMRVADFSCGAINSNGGEVDICAPGVDIFSSVPLPRRYARFPGTSMAAPHVAGVAALLAQSDPKLRGQALWQTLQRTSLDIGLSAQDGGAGFVQAPSSSTGDVLTS